MSGGVQRDSPTAPAAVWSPARARSAAGEPREVFEQTEYELFEEIGRGGMGRVYRAQHRKLKRPVAVKLLTDRRLDDVQAIARFLREMEIIGQLDHPHLVRAHDAGEIAGVHYLAMELVDGVDLHQLVRLVGALSVADACEIVRQAALGLQYAYLQGLVHQDVKPSNLLLSRNGVVKVADLGLARLDTWRESTELINTSDRIVGTFDFMAPEQALGSQHVDIGADIYGLGCTLFFLLAGRAPFAHPSHDTPAKKLMAHAAEPPPALCEVRTDVPQEVSQIVERSLAKRSQDRYAQPADIAAALAPFCGASNVAQLAATAISERSKAGDGPLPEPDPFAKTKSFRQILPSTDPATTRKATGARPERRLKLTFVAIIAAAAVGIGIYANRPPREDASAPQENAIVPPGRPLPGVAEDWRNRLGQLPRELEYPGHKGVGDLHFDEQNSSLNVTTDSIRLIKLGELDGKPCRLEVDILQPPWKGRVGIFLGYRPDVKYFKKEAAKFQLIHLIHTTDENQLLGFKLGREATIIDPNSLSLPTLNIPYSKPVAWPLDGEPLRLIIQIGPGGLEHVKWGGVEIEEIVKPKVNEQYTPDDYRGPWGLFVQRGTTWFSQPKVQIQE